MANNNWNNYTEKNVALTDKDEIMLRDSTDGKNKKSPLGKIWNYMVDKMATAVVSKLETDNKTIIGAINYLYGKSQTLDFIECRVKTVSGTVKITKETIISGTAPSLSSYIPIIIGHKSTNNVVDYVFYDSPNWIVKSDAEQEITIRFYKTAK